MTGVTVHDMLGVLKHCGTFNVRAAVSSARIDCECKGTVRTCPTILQYEIVGNHQRTTATHRSVTPVQASSSASTEGSTCSAALFSWALTSLRVHTCRTDQHMHMQAAVHCHQPEGERATVMREHQPDIDCMVFSQPDLQSLSIPPLCDAWWSLKAIADVVPASESRT
jgi:hypothetical protein